MACYEKVIDNIRQLNELGELPNSIFTDDSVGVGADSDSPNIVEFYWHSRKAESQEERWTRGGY